MVLTDLFSLNGRVALVTGCAQGLGKEIAVSLAQNGACLVLADIVSPDETAKQIKELGVRCISVQTDISDEESVANLTKETMSQFDKIDILVNNAGITQLNNTPTEDLATEEWDKVIRINLRGTFLCCKHIGKQMINSGGGTIINVGSTAGITGVPRAPAYSASKAGVILLTKALAVEWTRHNIRVNAIAPHYLETDMTKNLRFFPTLHSDLSKKIPMGRFGKPSEVIGCVLMLASSDASSYITGAIFPIDGGFLA